MRGLLMYPRAWASGQETRICIVSWWPFVRALSLSLSFPPLTHSLSHTLSLPFLFNFFNFFPARYMFLTGRGQEERDAMWMWGRGGDLRDLDSRSAKRSSSFVFVFAGVSSGTSQRCHELADGGARAIATLVGRWGSHETRATSDRRHVNSPGATHLTTTPSLSAPQQRMGGASPPGTANQLHPLALHFSPSCGPSQDIHDICR